MNMAKKRTGALIVIQREMDLSTYVQTGEMFNADVNTRLIENIFFKNSPLHDGAMIIADNKIKAAGCILPVAHNVVIPKEMGLRHRSGLGMSIETDAQVIIVSEERGAITVAQNGKLRIDISAEDLQQILSGEEI
jgi:DNA integrity scanning protein DisA with diadenylate cyclase activity